MTIPAASRRTLAAAVAGVLGAAAALGCGFVRDAKQVIDTATILGDFADRLGQAQELTYTAEYSVSGGDPVTLVRQPPNSAFVGRSGTFIVTREAILVCGTHNGATSCQRIPGAGQLDPSAAGPLAGVVGAGFIPPELALGLVTAAALVPGATVTESERRIGGEDSLCADVKGAGNAAQPGEQALQDFSVCVTETGVLAAFNGTSTTGERASIELHSVRATADATAFHPPAGAAIVDVTALPSGR